MQIHRISSNSSNANTISPTNTATQISNAYKKIIEFVKNKFKELWQLFLSVLNFKQKPVLTDLTRDLNSNKKIDRVLTNHKTPVSPARNDDIKTPKKDLTLVIQEENRIGKLAMAGVGIFFGAVGVAITYLNNSTSTLVESIAEDINLADISKTIVKNISSPLLNSEICPRFYGPHLFASESLLITSGPSSLELLKETILHTAISAVKNPPKVLSFAPHEFCNLTSIASFEPEKIISVAVHKSAKIASENLSDHLNISALPICGLLVVATAALAYGFFREKRINRELRAKLEEVKQNQGKVDLNTRKVEPLTLDIPAIPSEASEKPQEDKHVPREIIPQANNENPDPASIAVQPPKVLKVVPTIDMDKLNIPDTALSAPVKVKSPCKIEKPRIDFSRYHHPYFQAHDAFADKNSDYKSEIQDEKLKAYLERKDVVAISINGLVGLAKVGDNGESELQKLIITYQELKTSFENVLGKAEEWHLSEKLKIESNSISLVTTNVGRGGPPPPPQRGGPPPPPQRGGPAPPPQRGGPPPETKGGALANKKVQLKITEPLPLTQGSEIYIEYKKSKKRYDDKLVELRNYLTPDEKYKNYEFTYEELMTIYSNLESDLQIVEDFKKVKVIKTPRGQNITEPAKTESKVDEKILSKEEVKFIKKIEDYSQILVDCSTKINRLITDKNRCQSDVNKLVLLLNGIQPSNFFKVDRMKEIEEIENLNKQIKEIEDNILALENKRIETFKSIPDEICTPTKKNAVKNYTTSRNAADCAVATEAVKQAVKQAVHDFKKNK